MSRDKKINRPPIWQFSIGLLAAFVSLLSVVLAIQANGYRRQAHAVRWITDNGGHVYYDCQRVPDGGRILPLPDLEGWRAILGHDFFYRVVEVHAPKSITDQEAAILADLPDTEDLNLAYCFRISDLGIRHLNNLPNLKTLRLYRNHTGHNNFTFGFVLPSKPPITDESLKHLGTCRNLRELYLWDNEFTDSGLLHLRSAKQLEVLEFRSSAITAAGIAALREHLPTCVINGH